ncbi:MAG: hypothetical protein ABIG73_00440 [Patescibacteria group bacterium]
MCTEIKDLGRKLSDMKKEKSKKFVGQLKCFWTWPFGHIWGGHSGSYDRSCVICEATSTKGTYDGDWHYDLAAEYCNDVDGFYGARRRLKSSIALLKKQ